jgi:uncharacterized protein with GYD domain
VDGLRWRRESDVAALLTDQYRAASCIDLARKFKWRRLRQRRIGSPIGHAAVLDVGCSQSFVTAPPLGWRFTVQEEAHMPKYLVQANYSSEGVKGVLKEGGSARRAALEKVFASVGGKVEAFYFAFGDTDAFIIADVPDNVTAAALSLTASSHGTASSKVTVLLTPEEIDAATKKSINYRPPGK